MSITDEISTSSLLERIKPFLEGYHPVEIKDILENEHPENIAELMNRLNSAQNAEIFHALPHPLNFQVFECLEIEAQVSMLKKLNWRETVKLLEELSSDDRVDLIHKLPEQTVESLLPLMAQAEREEVRKLLQYGENTAGAIMTTEYAAIPSNFSVSESLLHLRKIAPNSETILYLYVVDHERKLIGTLSLKDLVLSKPYEIISDIMTKDIVTVDVLIDQEEVVKQFAKFDLFALPVVDSDHKLVGIITHDDILDVAVEEQTEDVHRLGALEPVEAPYLKAKFFQLAKNRGLWLLFLFFGVSFTGTALRHFEATMEHAMSLVYFLPLIVSTGGNSGSQSVTLITRALAVGDVTMKDFFRVAWRESAIGISLGLFLGIIGWVFAYFWGTPFMVCSAVGIALLGVVIAGCMIGAILPMLLKSIGLDPAIMSSPLVASIVDVIGIVIYFNVASLLL
ncbi:MAG: magnesium transporter [Bdellovibrionales bacterium]|nr:magnesium transporter [Bdellovibrionales bacterium]